MRWMLTLLVLVACKRAATTEATEATEATEPGHPAPPWPAPAQAVVPPGFERRTIHHETIHADVVIPAGARVDQRRDAHGYPLVTIAIDDTSVDVQFDSGIGALAATLARTPPTLYGRPVQRTSVTADNITARYLDANGGLRILGSAPGVKCRFESFGEVAEPTLDRIFTVCASLRSPPPGPWRAATVAERAHGGMTDVPAGAWVEGALPSHPGAALRPAHFTANMHAGAFVVSSSACPASFDELRTSSAPEVSVEVERRHSAGGDVWIRRATDTYDDLRFPGATVLLAPRDGRCCSVSFVPWTTFPTTAQVEYASALCDTYRAR